LEGFLFSTILYKGFEDGAKFIQGMPKKASTMELCRKTRGGVVSRFTGGGAGSFRAAEQ